jgi:hypothetical protein
MSSLETEYNIYKHPKKKILLVEIKFVYDHVYDNCTVVLGRPYTHVISTSTGSHNGDDATKEKIVFSN